MPSKLFTLLLLVYSITASAQYTLNGRVTDGVTNEPLPFATVYIDKTSTGTITDAEGKFSLNFSMENPGIVVSFVGYEPLMYQLNVSELARPYVFQLQPQVVQLSDIRVDGTRDSEWYANLQVFKEHLMGTTPFALNSTLLNPEVLIIDFSNKDRMLTVWAREPLRIENRSLGYNLQYSLQYFTYDMKKQLTTFAGYTYYQPMTGNKLQEKQWVRNREKAYNGSSTHFLQALTRQKLEEEGFRLMRLHREANPNYPSEEKLAAMRKEMMESGSVRISMSGGPTIMTNEPKIIETLDTRPVPYAEYLRMDSLGNNVLQYDGFFQVVYSGEKEDPAFVRYASPMSARSPGFQTSMISLTVPSTIINADGQPSQPFDLLFEGYWAWEKLCDMLPLDYKPKVE